MTRLLVAIAASLLLSSATAQLPIGAGFGEVEVQLRAQVDPSLFETQVSNLPATAVAGGNAKYVQGTNNAALFTLPNNGIAAGVIQLNPAGIFLPHYHPRANEILTVISGNVTIAFAEENAVDINGTMYGGRVLSYVVGQGASVTIPQGLIHYVANNNSCTQSQIVTAFDNRDPGTVSVVSSLFSLDNSVIGASTGLDQVAVQLVRGTASGLSLIGIDTKGAAACNGQAPPPAANLNNLLTATGSTGSVVSVSAQAMSPTGTPGVSGRKLQ